jgi:capsular polysaccharide transport system permease protein
MLLKSLLVQKRIIGAIVYRLVKSEHGTTGLGYLSAFLKPLGQIIFFSMIFTFMSRNLPLGDNHTIFLASGIIPLHLCLTVINRIMSVDILGKPLLKHPMISPIDISIAVLLMESGILIIVSLLVFLSVGLIGLWDFRIDSLLIIITTALFAIAIGFGVGLINLSIKIRIPTYPKIWQLMSMPLFIISGVFYTTDRLPEAVLEYLYYNPLLHITDSMRSGIYRSWDGDFSSYTYLTTFMVITIFLGLLFQRITDKLIRS